jgi:hypothetical protein
MCLRRAPEKCIAGAALDRAALDHTDMRPFVFRWTHVCMYVLAQHTLWGCCLDTDFRKR